MTSSRIPVQCEGKETPPARAFGMPVTADITSNGEGCFRWSLEERPISPEDGFSVVSPGFTFEDVDYGIILCKIQQSFLVDISLIHLDGTPIRGLSFEFELSAEDEIASDSTSVTVHEEASICADCETSIEEFLSKRRDRTFRGSLVVSFRLRKEPPRGRQGASAARLFPRPVVVDCATTTISSRNRVLCEEKETPASTFSMATDSITSDGEGRVRWKLRQIEISWEDDFSACCPLFTFKGADYSIHLHKMKQSTLIETTLVRLDGAPIRSSYFECELCAENESASHLHSVTAGYITSNYLISATSIEEFLSKRRDRTYRGHFIFSFRLSIEPPGGRQGAGAEVAEGSNKALEKNPEYKSRKKMFF